MKKSSKKTQVELFYWLKIGLLAVVLISVVSSIWLRDSAVNAENMQKYVDSKQNHEIKKLTFCTDRDIKPCDKESLIIWNDDHQNDQFQPIHGPDLMKIDMKKVWLFE